MKTYIGTKIINAEPMSRYDFVEEQVLKDNPSYVDADTVSIPPKEGYKVIYEDGYESWSPKETFERAYREITSEEKILIDEVK